MMISCGIKWSWEHECAYTYLFVISLFIPDLLAAVCLDGTLDGVYVVREEKTGSIFTCPWVVTDHSSF